MEKPDYKKERETLENLKKKESFLGMLIATGIGIAPTATFFFVAPEFFTTVFAWITPGIILGVFVRLAISAHSLKLRLIPALLVFLLGPLLFLATFNPFTLLIGVTNLFLVLLITRPKLSKEEERALWLQRQGKL